MTVNEAISFLIEAGFEARTRKWALGNTIVVLSGGRPVKDGIVSYEHLAYITIDDVKNCSILIDCNQQEVIGSLDAACDRVIKELSK